MSDRDWINAPYTPLQDGDAVERRPTSVFRLQENEDGDAEALGFLAAHDWSIKYDVDHDVSEAARDCARAAERARGNSQAKEELGVSPSYMVYMYRKQALLLQEVMDVQREISGFHDHLTQFVERLTMRPQTDILLKSIHAGQLHTEWVTFDAADFHKTFLPAFKEFCEEAYDGEDRRLTGRVTLSVTRMYEMGTPKQQEHRFASYGALATWVRGSSRACTDFFHNSAHMCCSAVYSVPGVAVPAAAAAEISIAP